MDFPMGNDGHSGDEMDLSDPSSHDKGRNKVYHRHTPKQIQALEAFFKECPHPDDSQRRQLSQDLGLEAKQVKFWFQNKRTQIKTQTERAGNSVLRAENDRILCENLAIREALRNIICPSCGGPPFGEEDRQRSLQKLQIENAQLKEEHEKVSSLLARYLGKPVSHLESFMPTQSMSQPTAQSMEVDFMQAGDGTQRKDKEVLDLGLNPGIPENTALTGQFKGANNDMETAAMAEAAASAMDELTKLFQTNEPLWVRSSILEGRYTIDRDSYENLFPRGAHFKGSGSRFESSKDSEIVSMNAMQLVDMFLDSDQWSNLFPTIVTKARTLQVLETGMVANRDGCLQLMYEEMHILSPLVAPRDFYFLRYCRQIEAGVWVIADVSYDLKKETSPTWRFPSGCMIQEMGNASINVTWIEHVEIDDSTQPHRLYRHLVCGSYAYGAERWIIALQRMSDRFALALGDSAHVRDFGGVITMPEGRRSIMKLSHRMVKSFCSVLSMTGKLEFFQLSEANSGVRVSVRKNTEPGHPYGVIVTAASSLWIPLPCEAVFEFLRDEKMRVQWDVLCNGKPVSEVGHLETGTYPGNFISIIRQPLVPKESMVMLQECCSDALGSMVVYAPVDIASMTMAISGEDSSSIAMLPSGFIISSDGRQEAAGSGGASASSSGRVRSGGSYLTVAIQILVAGCTSSTALSMQSIGTVNTLMSTTVHKIKTALGCSDLN